MTHKGHELGTHVAAVATKLHKHRGAHKAKTLTLMAEQAAERDRTEGTDSGGSAQDGRQQ